MPTGTPQSTTGTINANSNAATKPEEEQVQDTAASVSGSELEPGEQTAGASAMGAGLKAGQIIGIVIGVVVAAALLLAVTYMLVRNHMSIRQNGGSGLGGGRAGTPGAGGALAVVTETPGSTAGPGASWGRSSTPSLPTSTGASQAVTPRGGGSGTASSALSPSPLSPRGLRYENLRQAAQLEEVAMLDNTI